MEARNRFVRGAAVVTAAGLIAGMLAITPAGAAKFLTKKKALNLFYTKAQADQKFLDQAEGDAAFLTPAEGNAEFLGGTVTVVNRVSVTGATAYTNISVDCPAGFTATGGGVHPLHDDIRVLRSSPAIGGTPVGDSDDGQYGSPNGWAGRIQNNNASLQLAAVVAVCAQ